MLSPGPGLPTADMSHPMNYRLGCWYACTHGEAGSIWDIGPRRCALPKTGGLFNTSSIGPRGNGPALQADVSSSDNSGFSGSAPSTRNEQSPFGLTISGWVYVQNTSIAGNNIFAENGSGTQQLAFAVNDSLVQLTTRNTSGVARTINSTIPGTQQWVFCAVTQEGTNGWLYVDGVEVATSTTLRNGTHDATITRSVTTTNDGAPPGGSFTRYQNIRVWHRVLSAQEILSLYYNPWQGIALPGFIYSPTSPPLGTTDKHLLLLGVS